MRAWSGSLRRGAAPGSTSGSVTARRPAAKDAPWPNFSARIPAPGSTRISGGSRRCSNPLRGASTMKNLSREFATMTDEERRRFALEQGQTGAGEGNEDAADELVMDDPRNEAAGSEYT